MYHAPSVLRGWIQEVLNLEMVPNSVKGEYWNFSSVSARITSQPFDATFT